MDDRDRWLERVWEICGSIVTIVLLLQGVSTRDFNIFDVDEVFFFTLRTILLLNEGDNFSGLLVGFFVPYLFGLFK